MKRLAALLLGLSLLLSACVPASFFNVFAACPVPPETLSTAPAAVVGPDGRIVLVTDDAELPTGLQTEPPAAASGAR